MKEKKNIVDSLEGKLERSITEAKEVLAEKGETWHPLWQDVLEHGIHTLGDVLRFTIQTKTKEAVDDYPDVVRTILGELEKDPNVKVNRIKNYWKRNNAFYGVNAIFDIELTKDDLKEAETCA